jgi:D-glycero-D-manno-heptose 1,7-bisphosphate phosphatase
MKRPAVFFDRDNTLIVSDGYLGDPAKVVLVEGAADAVARVRQLGYAVVVASNQSGVARGMFSEEDVQAVNTRMDELLAAENPAAVVDRHEFCPFHPDGTVDVYARDSDRRKPKPGMLLSAAEKLALDLSRSWVIGDAGRDIEAARAAGCRAILFRDPNLPKSAAAEGAPKVQADYEVTTLAEAVDFVERNPEPGPLVVPGAARVTASTASVQVASGPRVILSPEPDPEDAPPAGGETVAEQSDHESGQPALPEGARRVPKVAIGSRYVPPEGKEGIAGSATTAREAIERRKAFRAEFKALLEAGKSEEEAEAEANAVTGGGGSVSGARSAMSSGTPMMPSTPVTSGTPGDRTESLLEQIFLELRRQHEHEDEDFSVSKLLAGIVQILVLAVLFLAYLRRTEGPGSVQTYLEVALVLQTMTIALLIMSRQR